MEILVKTLEDEIKSYIESNGNDIRDNSFNFSFLKTLPEFSLFRYLYENMSLSEIFESKTEGLSNLIKPTYLRPEYDLGYKLSTQNPILVGVKKSYSKVKGALKSKFYQNNIRIEQILDIEFFEFYQSQYNFLKNFLGNESDLINPKCFTNSKILSLIQYLQKDEFKAFNEEHRFLGFELDGIADFLDEESKYVSPNIFTSFLDTEKIHLKLGLVFDDKNQSEFPVLLYFGYGNYYPFTRNISQKNVAKLRFNKINALNGTNEDIFYVKRELSKTQSQRNNQLLNLIDNSQINYMPYFQENFSYEKRANLYRGKSEINRGLDELFKLPDEIRTKSAALIAYDYFSAL